MEKIVAQIEFQNKEKRNIQHFTYDTIEKLHSFMNLNAFQEFMVCLGEHKLSQEEFKQIKSIHFNHEQE